MNGLMRATRRILVDYSVVLAYLFAIGSWQFVTNTPLTVRTILTLAAFCALSNLFGYLSASLRALSAPSVEKPEKREFVDDPRAILDLAKLKGYESIRLFAPYLGKWMTISGVYDGAAKSLDQDSIHVSIFLEDNRRINLRFDAERSQQIRRFKIGQRITAICQIQHRNFTFTPENCELLRIAESYIDANGAVFRTAL